MNGKYVLKIFDSLEELNTLLSPENDRRVTVFYIDAFNYGLLVYSSQGSHITLLKLTVKEIIFNEDNLELIPNEEAFRINLLHVFSLPFAPLKVICTKNNIWAIGEQSALDLQPYVESAFKKALIEENDDYMDIDDAEEFHDKIFDISINVHNQQKYDFHFGDIFIGCNSMKYGFIHCHKNSKLNVWQLKLILLNDEKKKSSDRMVLSFLDFPVSYSKRDVAIHSYQGQTDTFQPVILFILHSDPESHSFREIFGKNCSPSNILCIIGHPDGKLLWSFCDCNKQFHSSDKSQILYDIKQPIIGIYFVDNIEEFEGYVCMLIVGVLGQITLFSSKKHPSFTHVPGQHPFWIKTVHLKSSIMACTVVNDCLLHISNGMLWISDLSLLLNTKEEAKESCLASNSLEFCCLEQMVIVNEKQGLMLLLTSSGNIHLTVCKQTLDHDTVTSSLPSLMNECLQQSTMMQELLHKKVLQSRLFTTISAFASLKFCANTLKEPITFSISEVNLEPRKYILVINFKCFEKLHLDSELCHVTATVFTYFEKNFSLISKTASYIVDQPTLCLEFTDTVLQPPFVSVFPLFVELGLILQLPEKWKVIDCFKSVASCLPFYLRVQTFMVHELHLFQSNTLCSPQSYRYEKPRAMRIIEELALKRPISNILQVESKQEYQLPTKFNLCLSASSVKEMMKNTEGSDPCEYIKNILLKNMCSNSSPEKTIKQNPISLEVINKNDKIVISLTASSFDSLIGLRIAVMDILHTTHNQSKHLISSSTFVSIPASIYKKCEDISKSLLSLYGKDVESDEITEAIMQLYQELRRDVSAKLPIL